MNILVTAGNTLVPVDRVRCISNIFTGRTGASIALCAWERGHRVTLLTSHPEVVADLRDGASLPEERWALRRYSTFDQLNERMTAQIGGGDLDAVVHCAAVSDYLSAGVFAPAPGTQFRPEDGRWHAAEGDGPAMLDRAAGKVKSDEPELWLRLVRAPKLIDKVRGEWAFTGALVKFKLEVGIGDDDLLEVAERSRQHSNADLMVANTLEGAPYYAFLGPLDGAYQRLSRRDLAPRLLDAIELLHARRQG
jgi:phosphopantothenoylcysteine synthetase/decarboxylase